MHPRKSREMNVMKQDFSPDFYQFEHSQGMPQRKSKELNIKKQEDFSPDCYQFEHSRVMPPRKSKELNKVKYNLRRPPVGMYPHVYAEKENTSSSADDSPEKMFPVGSGSQRKTTSPSDIDQQNAGASEYLKNRDDNQHVSTKNRYWKNHVGRSPADDTPKIFPSGSPGSQRKTISPSDIDPEQSAGASEYLKNRKGDNQHVSTKNRYWENPVDREMGIKADNYPLNQRQSESPKYEVLTDTKNVWREADKREYFTEIKKRNRRNSREKPEQSEINYRPTLETKQDHQQKKFDYNPDHKIKPPKIHHSQCTTNCGNVISEGFTRKLWILFFAVLFIILIIFITKAYWDTDKSDQLNAATLMENLKSKFPDQSVLTYRIIHSALKNVLVKEPTSPAIILLLATNGSTSVCADFASKLVDSLSVPENTLKTFGKKYRTANVNRAKKDMDEAIRNTLKENQLGSVILNDLDQIPGQVAIMLHSYCDHENAPFKKAVFVMTVNYDKAVSDSSETEIWDKIAHDYLLSVWTDLGVDQVEPLIGRLTVSVALIRA